MLSFRAVCSCFSPFSGVLLFRPCLPVDVTPGEGSLILKQQTFQSPTMEAQPTFGAQSDSCRFKFNHGLFKDCLLLYMKQASLSSSGLCLARPAANVPTNAHPAQSRIPVRLPSKHTLRSIQGYRTISVQPHYWLPSTSHFPHSTTAGLWACPNIRRIATENATAGGTGS